MSSTAPAVLQVLPRLESGGVERGTVEIAAALGEAGWRAYVAAEPGRLVDDLARVGATFVELPLASKNPLTLARNAGRLARLVREHDVDVVHARSRAPAWSALAAARRTERPFVTTFHSIYSGSANALKRRYNAVMTRGDVVIAISDYVARHIAAHYGPQPARVRTVPRAVDTALFDPDRVDPERVRRLRDAWGLAGDAATIVLPGRVTRRKGHLQLVGALARLARRDVRALCVGPDTGDGRYRREVEAAARAAGVAERVVFTGQCDDMPAAYLLADVVAVPSVETPEAFGRVSVEAQAMGRPVVVSRLGGLPETLIEGRTGWSVPAGDDAALAHALATSLELEAAERASFAARARTFVVEHYALARMTEATLAIYRELAGCDPANT